MKRGNLAYCVIESPKAGEVARVRYILICKGDPEAPVSDKKEHRLHFSFAQGTWRPLFQTVIEKLGLPLPNY